MIRIAAVGFALLPVCADAVECRDMRFDGASYTICEADPAREHIGLYLKDAHGDVLGGFAALRTHLAPVRVVFAMNAGMYHADRSPVGHYVEDGVEQMRVVTNAGPGNFGLLPNGILCLSQGRATVWETLSFQQANPVCDDATQSGPMLVIDDALHPRFIPGGESKFIRNGVGSRDDGTLVFAISNEPVNFDSFGRLFRDELNTPNALFLDGRVSRLYAPQLGRFDFGFAPLGPMVAITEPAE